jgi:predicted nucleotidyltransferase
LAVEALLRQLAQLQPIFEEHPDIAAVYLFGSQVDGYALPWSDIDLGMLWKEPVAFAKELALDTEISLALGTDSVDVVNLNKAPLPLQHRAISRGILLYEGAPDRLSIFLEETMRRYFDFRPLLEMYHREFAKSLDHDYAHGSRRR